jgi:hypothetical protein
MKGEAIRIPVALKCAAETTDNDSAGQLAAKAFAVGFLIDARAGALGPYQRKNAILCSAGKPGIGTNDAAAGADHARAKRWHWHVIGPRVGAQDRPVVTQPAARFERPHPIRALLPRVIGGPA